MPKTLLDKIWERHVVDAEPGKPALLYIDLHLVHEVTSPRLLKDSVSPGDGFDGRT